MFLYPIAYRSGWLDLTPQQMGIFSGATLHEVAHAVGAGNAMGQRDLQCFNNRENDTRHDACTRIADFRLLGC